MSPMDELKNKLRKKINEERKKAKPAKPH